MTNQLEITDGQLATLLWIKALDDFEDGINITLQDKYYNFIENNSVIEGMEVAEFINYKKMLVANGLLKETDKKLEFTKKGKEIVGKICDEDGVKASPIKKGKFPSFTDIKRFINDNSDVIQAVLATTSVVLSIIEICN